MTKNIQKGDVFQLGKVDPTKGWEKQPPLVYVTGPAVNGIFPAVYHNGFAANLPADRLTESRGNVTAADLDRIVRKNGKKAPR